MKEFFWDYFSRTGNIDAYILYKDNDEEWQEEGSFLQSEDAEREYDREA